MITLFGNDKYNCRPDAPTAGELTDIVLAFLIEYPKERVKSAPEDVLEALSGKYLCDQLVK
jgi:hypothetical protein